MGTLEEMLENFKKGYVENKNTNNIINQDNVEKNDVDEAKRIEELKKQEMEEHIQKEINNTIKVLNRTKFKNRIEGKVIDGKVVFYLDNEKVYSNTVNNILSFFCIGELAQKVKERCFELEGINELKYFIEKKCIVYNEMLPKNMRTYKNEFIKAYLDFLKYEVHNPIKVNLNKLNSILIHNYGENIIKSGTRHWLTKITLKEKINNINILGENIDSNEKIKYILEHSLVDFIENYCIVRNGLKPSSRLKRTNFRKGYVAYCNENNIKPLDIHSFNKVLYENYNETFIKSNGIWYMKKIKFKNFN